MSYSNPKPFWQGFDLQNAPFLGTSLGNIINITGNVFDQLQLNTNGLAGTAAWAKNVLDDWNDKTSPIGDAAVQLDTFTAGLADWADSQLSEGIHFYIPVPRNGGFANLYQSLQIALNRTTDANAPTFKDDFHCGGFVLLVSGSLVKIIGSMITLMLLHTRGLAGIGQGVSTLLNASAPFGNLYNDFFQAIANGEHEDESWSSPEVKEFIDWYKLSTIRAVTGGDDPWGAALAETPEVPIEPGVVDPASSGDAIQSIPIEDPFEKWRTVARIAELFPGAVTLADQAIKILDQASGLVKNVAIGADAIGDGVNFLGNLAGNFDALANDVLQGAKGATVGFLDDLTNFNASLLTIPPMPGGMHQFSWTLSQGLSRDAEGAPDVAYDDWVGGVLYVCGRNDEASVLNGMRGLLAALGMGGLVP